MALQQNYTTASGIELVDAYHRIDTFRGDRNNVRLGIGVYVNQQAREDGKAAAGFIELALPTPNTSANMFADAYTWIKTQPGFESAQDV